MSTTFTPAAPVRNADVARGLARRRKMIDMAVRWFCIGATLLALVFLASIIVTLLWRGLASMDLTIFTTEFRPTTYGDPTAEKGGLLHAISGSLVMVSLATLIGTPIGLLVGTYSREALAPIGAVGPSGALA